MKLKNNAIFAEKSVKDINLGDRAEYIEKVRVLYESYDDNWKLDYFDDNTSGYLVTEKGRIMQSEKSKNETIKFLKEQEMCMTLARNGHKIEHLDDKWGESYDIHIDGIKADLKKTRSHNNIVNYAKEAIRDQGAEMVIFEFEKETEMIHAEIIQLYKKSIRAKYYFSHNKNIIYDL